MCVIYIKNTEDRLTDSVPGERIGSRGSHRLRKIYSSSGIIKGMTATLDDIREVQGENVMKLF